jgi:hypothetical protein
MDDLTYTESQHDTHERFHKERGKANRQDLVARLTGRDDDLLPFEGLAKMLQAYQHIPPRAPVMIPLNRIVGSVGRYRDFTRDFRPRDGVSRDRWVRVYRAMTSLQGVPPIEVYALGDVFFVADGNHRVSAARAGGFDHIAAHVTEIPVDAGIDPGDTLDSAIIKAERVRFLAESGLGEHLAATDDIRFTKPGGYLKLLEHIQVHRYFMGLDHPGIGEVSFQDAAVSWYTRVYQPIAATIQKHNLLQQFSDSTIADLYVWVSGRIMELEKQYGEKVSVDTAVVTLQGESSGTTWQRAFREVMRVLSEIKDALVSPEHGIPEWAGQALEWGDFRPPPTYSIPEAIHDERRDDSSALDPART